MKSTSPLKPPSKRDNKLTIPTKDKAIKNDSIVEKTENDESEDESRKKKQHTKKAAHTMEQYKQKKRQEVEEK